MKNIFTILIIIEYITITNFVLGQEPISFSKTIDQTFQPWSDQTDFDYSRAFVYTGAGPYQLNKQFLGGTTLTPVGPTVTFGTPAACTVNPLTGVLYAIDMSSPYSMYTVDTTTGDRTLLYNCTGVPQTSLTGITWNMADNKMYGISTNLSASSIFTINMTTGVCTPIGSASTLCKGAISISASRTGTLFVVCIVTDGLYRFNKTTGVATFIGSLGLNANSNQDAQFDVGDNKLYWASFSTTSQLRIIDTLNGSSTLIGTYGTQALTLGIFSKFVGIDNIIDNTDVNVYPNPSKNTVKITAPGIETIKIFNNTGQVIESIIVNNSNAQIDVSNYYAGVYFVQVKTEKGLITKKITVTK